MRWNGEKKALPCGFDTMKSSRENRLLLLSPPLDRGRYFLYYNHISGRRAAAAVREEVPMTKRWIAALLAALLTVSLTSCGLITITTVNGPSLPEPPPEETATPAEPEPEPDRFTVTFDENEVFPNEAARRAAEHIDPAIRSAVKLLNSMPEEDEYVVEDCDYSKLPKERDSLTDPIALDVYDTLLEAMSTYGDYHYNERDYKDFFPSYATGLDALRIDHRKLFLYCDGGYKNFEYMPIYYMPGDWMNDPCDDLDAIRQEVAVFDAVVERIMTKMPEGLTNYRKCCYFAFVLASTVSYDDGYETLANNFQEYNALVKNTAVCQGYARAFSHLCREAGISCRYCAGTVINYEERHAWNEVDTDKGVMLLDITWYDQPSLSDDDWRSGDDYYLFAEAADTEMHGHITDYTQW